MKSLTCAKNLADSVVVAQLALGPTDEVSSTDAAVRVVLDRHWVGCSNRKSI